MRIPSLLAAVALLVTLEVGATPRTETLFYTDGETRLGGYLSLDDAHPGPRPGVLVLHEWWGLNDHVRAQARRLTELGYVVFAADLYGTGRVTEHAADAKAWMTQLSEDPEAWRQRALAGLDVLRKRPEVDPERIVALGYCFGAATAMQLAYAGAPLAGVVSVHGSLPPPPPELGHLSPAVLALHGAADPMVPTARVHAFQHGLERLGADWQLVIYGGARHGFTNPGADRYKLDGVAYDARAAQRAWRMLETFLDEVLTTAP
ncbi:dienelactone hydrolase family protein [Marichromatium gracile]|uniref:dienelactone hydrolase family protein n=1 Tax=Marichromatium gracile TaxID=1048 RepID=UPI001F3DF85C|nr:dienelactone hydrolase family protein [Marichromatium gracile]MCF1182115.1 dienelactone hydrolase family protein [Marichromatium gracile]